MTAGQAPDAEFWDQFIEAWMTAGQDYGIHPSWYKTFDHLEYCAAPIVERYDEP